MPINNRNKLLEGFKMSFKDDMITQLTLRNYHDINNITVFKDQIKIAKCYDKIIRMLNEADITQRDVINLLKNLTLNTIGQSNEDYIKYQEDKNRKQMQRDLK